VRGLLKFYRITLAPRKTNQPNSDFIQGVGELARHEFLAKAVSQFVYLSLSASGRMRIEFKIQFRRWNAASLVSTHRSRSCGKCRPHHERSGRYKLLSQR
jgi:hypothetical protein